MCDKDTRYYEEAWQVSGCRSARAQKSLGLYYMREKAWSNCVDCLQLSLRVNPLQVSHMTITRRSHCHHMPSTRRSHDPHLILTCQSHDHRTSVTGSLHVSHVILVVSCPQEGLWFTLACAANRINNLSLAIKAGHQAVTLDPSVRCDICYSLGGVVAIT